MSETNNNMMPKEDEESLIRTHGIMVERKCVNDGLTWTVATTIFLAGALTMGGWAWMVFLGTFAWTVTCFIQAGVLRVRMNLGTYGRIKYEREYILRQMRRFRHQ